MADGGIEDAGSVIVVRPSDDRFLVALLAGGESMGGGEDCQVVVELLVASDPIFKGLGDRMFFIHVHDGDRLVWAMPGGLKSEVFEPLRSRRSHIFSDGLVKLADAVGVHGAMQIYSRNTCFVGRKHAFDYCFVADICGAFVMDYHVVAFGVIWETIDRKVWFHGGVVRVNLVNDDVCACLDTFFEDVFLSLVIVAAAAGDEQSLEGLRLGIERG
jgi:hypothetical protein